MSDCSQNAWRVPEQREPGVLYMHGQPGTDYAAVQTIEVDGQRFERVVKRDTCHDVSTNPLRFECSACGGVSLEIAPRYCPICDCLVVSADD